MFELFDPQVDYEVGTNKLPHWYQPGVTYFITFRTTDSLPRSVSELWYRKRNDWLARHGIDWRQEDWPRGLEQLTGDLQREFHSTFSYEYLEHLDRGHGECVLKCPDLAQIVADSLLHFDGVRYHMGDFIVMPNHVHLLVCLLSDTKLKDVCYSWKKFTATKINQHLERRGSFWQSESFDHLVRSPDQFEHLQKYIAGNRASLDDGTFYLHQRELCSRGTRDAA
jgi:REP element-mobilizing transposase RayT